MHGQKNIISKDYSGGTIGGIGNRVRCYLGTDLLSRGIRTEKNQSHVREGESSIAGIILGRFGTSFRTEAGKETSITLRCIQQRIGSVPSNIDRTWYCLVWSDVEDQVEIHIILVI